MALIIGAPSPKSFTADRGTGYLRVPNYGGWAAGTTTPSANQLRAVRFKAVENMTVTKMACFVSTNAGSNDSIDMGILDASGNRLGSMGATAGLANVTGKRVGSLTASVSLVAGTEYFAALAYGAIGTTAAAFIAASYGANAATASIGTSGVTGITGWTDSLTGFTSVGTVTTTPAWSVVSAGYMLELLES